MNGQIFSNLNGNACGNEKETMPNGVDKEKYDNEKNVVLTNEQLILLDDQRQELSDLRRQVVYLQVSIINLNDDFSISFITACQMLDEFSKNYIFHI